MAVGAESHNIKFSSIDIDNCNGDAAISVESSSSFVEVSDWQATNCAKSAASISFANDGYPFPNDTTHGVKIHDGIGRARAPMSIAAITKGASTVVTTTTPHYMKSIGDTISLSFAGVGGMTQLNGNAYFIHIIDASRFQLLDGSFNPVDSSAFGAYTSGGTASVHTMGVNVYASSDPLFGTGLVLSDIELDGYNTGIEVRYQKQCRIKNISCTNLQGPGSAVAKFQYVQGAKIRDVVSYDSITADHAFQFLNLGASVCDNIDVSGLEVLVSGINPAYMGLVYIEGGGMFRVRDLRTGGSSHYIHVPAGSSPVIFASDMIGSVTSDPVGGGGTPIMLKMFGNQYNSNDFTYVGGCKFFQTGSMPTSAGNPGDRAFLSPPVVGQPKSWVCLGGTTWESEGNLT